jgi:16S rRNA processing protein RimM
MRSRVEVSSSRPKDEESKVRVARIGAAHGVRGEMKLWSFTQDPTAVAEYSPLETADGTRVEIESMRAAKDHFVVRIEGIEDRDAAAKLCNLDLYVPRDRLPPITEEDTYYHADMIGMTAVSETGITLGTVAALHNFGAGDLIEIVTAQGGEPLLLPFTTAIVTEIDVAARRLVVVLPTQIE